MAKTKSTTKPKTGKQKLAASAPSAPNIDIGITQGDRKKIADGLARFQADAFTLYLKTHNFHWNVTGSMFNSLHTMFETQYTEQWGHWTMWPSASAHWASMPRAPTGNLLR